MAEPQSLALDYESRYRDTAERTYEGKKCFELWERPFEVNFMIENSIHHRVVESEVGRLDLLAYAYFDNVKFWWILAAVNELSNPLRDMFPGQVIYIPNLDDILAMFARPSTIMPVEASENT